MKDMKSNLFYCRQLIDDFATEPGAVGSPADVAQVVELNKLHDLHVLHGE
jgi:hypothetical protein